MAMQEPVVGADPTLLPQNVETEESHNRSQRRSRDDPTERRPSLSDMTRERKRTSQSTLQISLLVQHHER
jgi:hypothetical protein